MTSSLWRTKPSTIGFAPSSDRLAGCTTRTKRWLPRRRRSPGIVVAILSPLSFFVHVCSLCLNASQDTQGQRRKTAKATSRQRRPNVTRCSAQDQAIEVRFSTLASVAADSMCLDYHLQHRPRRRLSRHFVVRLLKQNSWHLRSRSQRICTANNADSAVLKLQCCVPLQATCRQQCNCTTAQRPSAALNGCWIGVSRGTGQFWTGVSALKHRLQLRPRARTLGHLRQQQRPFPPRFFRVRNTVDAACYGYGVHSALLSGTATHSMSSRLTVVGLGVSGPLALPPSSKPTTLLTTSTNSMEQASSASVVTWHAPVSSATPAHHTPGSLCVLLQRARSNLRLSITGDSRKYDLPPMDIDLPRSELNQQHAHDPFALAANEQRPWQPKPEPFAFVQQPATPSTTTTSEQSPLPSPSTASTTTGRHSPRFPSATPHHLPLPDASSYDVFSTPKKVSRRITTSHASAHVPPLVGKCSSFDGQIGYALRRQVSC